jgi:hypothetical protein
VWREDDVNFRSNDVTHKLWEVPASCSTMSGMYFQMTFRKLTIKELIYMYSQAIVCHQYLCLLFIVATCFSSSWTVVKELHYRVKYICTHYGVNRNLQNRNVCKSSSGWTHLFLLNRMLCLPFEFSNNSTAKRRWDVTHDLQKQQLYTLVLFPSMHKASFSAYACFDYLR